MGKEPKETKVPHVESNGSDDTVDLQTDEDDLLILGAGLAVVSGLFHRSEFSRK